MNTKFKCLILLVILAMLAAPLVGALAASGTPVVTTGYDSDAIYKATVSYRNLNSSGNSEEVKLTKTNPTEDLKLYSCVYGSNNKVTFSYDPVLSTLSTSVYKIVNGAEILTCTGNLAVVDLGALNYIRIDMKLGTRNTSISFNDVSIDGIPLVGPFYGNNTTNQPKTYNWAVKGLSLNDGFTLQGNLALSGRFAGGDSNFVDILVGDLGPVVSNVTVLPAPLYLNGPATVSARINDGMTGPDIVASANYNLDGGSWLPWTPMFADDDAFDEITEDVYANFDGSLIGPHTTCVYSTDINGNQGAAACHDFLVDYMFYGFDEPITMGTTNLVKGGQTIPTIWRLTDHWGVGIDNPGSFAGLFSYPVSCDEINDPIDVVQETAPGDSGLQYLGDGYWQFNWKTLKSYAGSCRAMYVEFDSTTTSPVVIFQFK